MRREVEVRLIGSFDAIEKLRTLVLEHFPESLVSVPKPERDKPGAMRLYINVAVPVGENCPYRSRDQRGQPVCLADNGTVGVCDPSNCPKEAGMR
jgi:hypothetical protein